jgi:beta-glucanase (GH16 family)
VKRRELVGILTVAVLTATTSAAFGDVMPVASGGFAAGTTVTATRPVPSSGKYRVIVQLRADTSETAALYVPEQPERSMHLRARFTATTTWTLNLKASLKQLVVQAVGPQPGVRLKLKLVDETTPTVSSTTPPTGKAPDEDSTNASASSSTPAPTTGSTTPATGSGGSGGSTPAPPQQAPNPYTKLVMDDEFAGAAGAAPNSDGANLTNYVGNGNCGSATLNTDTSSLANASLDGHGDLAITALANGSGADPYTSAELESPFTSEYGAVEARMELPPGQGLCSAFWLAGAPTDGNPPVSTPCVWPACGEIDIDESPAFVGSQYPNFPLYSVFTLHGPISGTSNTQQWELAEPNPNSIGNPTTGFHTYGIIWSPNSITWTLDGVAYATVSQATVDAYVAANDPGSTPSWEFDDHNFFVILDLAVGGWPGSPTAADASEFPATMLVNWVRWYGCQTGTPQNGCT